jgi:hypothetical protein
MTALPEVRRETSRGSGPPANFDDFEAWIDADDPPPWPNPDPQHREPLLELAIHIDLFAGEFFRNNWRRRLADSEGNFGHVARQMRKAGVPLDLALAILLMPDRYVPVLRDSVMLVGDGRDNGGLQSRVRLKLVR